MERSGAVLAQSCAVVLAEEFQNFTRLCMSARGRLRVQQLTVDLHVEDSARTADDPRLGDGVLMGRQKIVDRAHGVTQIISTNAVLDAYLMHDHKRMSARGT